VIDETPPLLRKRGRREIVVNRRDGHASTPPNSPAMLRCRPMPTTSEPETHQEFTRHRVAAFGSAGFDGGDFARSDH